MDKKKESMQGRIPEKGSKEYQEAVKENIITNKFKSLEYRMKKLEVSIRILEVLAQKFANENGIRVERFQDGLVIISQL